jgi:DNA modification methylase
MNDVLSCSGGDSSVRAITIFDDGVAICGAFPDEAVLSLVREHARGPLPLTIADPMYGHVLKDARDRTRLTDVAYAAEMVGWTRALEALSAERSALYVWGGIGRPRDGKKPPFRPFYRYLLSVEEETGYSLASHITWSKRRAYGVSHNYLFCREELAYLVLGPDVKKPRCFNIPLLSEERGYDGFNSKYPAKSRFLRRTNVWRDITEIFAGKVHEAQKPQRLMEIPIEVHTLPGETVFDPFAGSGTSAQAARKLGRRFIVVEKAPADFAGIVSRLGKPMPEGWAAEELARVGAPVRAPLPVPDHDQNEKEEEVP